MPQRYAREFRARVKSVNACLPANGSARFQMRVVSRRRPSTGGMDQALIDAGLKEGTKSIEVDELAQARKTIEELEAELAAVKAEGPCSTGRSLSAQKAVPGCRGTEQPGLLRACGQPCGPGL